MVAAVRGAGMSNERLRSSMRRAGVTAGELATLTGVDAKTVYRWVSPGRPPLPRHRVLVARRLGDAEEWLWPGTTHHGVIGPDGDVGAELVAAYPYRSDAPVSLWWNLITRANRRVDLLGYTLYFLSLQHPELVATLEGKCADGVKIRAAIGDPGSAHVAYRDREECTPLTLVVRIQTTLRTWAPLLGRDGFELRYQDVPLYNSVFRFDDEMLVTPHLFAMQGSHAPLLHLRRLGPGGLFSRFSSHFDAVWSVSTPHPATITTPDGAPANAVTGVIQ
jgi:predicted DNA-binding transcriptional regulator AlpA